MPLERAWVLEEWIRWYVYYNILTYPKISNAQIQSDKGDVTITNDGATILNQMQVLHPVARMVH